MPTTPKDLGNQSCIGVWVYGLDLGYYQGSSDDSDIIRQSGISIRNNKSEYKLALVKSPFLWMALVKFFRDERISSRISVGGRKDTFVLVHFLSQSSTPQFYEFSLSSVMKNIRDSLGNEGREMQIKRQCEGDCTILGLNHLDPFESTSIPSILSCLYW